MKTPNFTTAAKQNIKEVGIAWKQDFIAMRDLGVTPTEMLEICLDGADDDRVQGWRDYVDALVEAM